MALYADALASSGISQRFAVKLPAPLTVISVGLSESGSAGVPALSIERRLFVFLRSHAREGGGRPAMRKRLTCAALSDHIPDLRALKGDGPRFCRGIKCSSRRRPRAACLGRVVSLGPGGHVTAHRSLEAGIAQAPLEFQQSPRRADKAQANVQKLTDFKAAVPSRAAKVSRPPGEDVCGSAEASSWQQPGGRGLQVGMTAVVQINGDYSNLSA